MSTICKIVCNSNIFSILKTKSKTKYKIFLNKQFDPLKNFEQPTAKQQQSQKLKSLHITSIKTAPNSKFWLYSWFHDLFFQIYI